MLFSKSVKLVASDLEGCLLEAGGGTTPWRTDKLAILAEFMEKIEIPFILVTGRQAPYAEAVLQSIHALNREIFNIPSVCEGGAILYYPNTRKYEFNPNVTVACKKMMNEVQARLDDWMIGQKEYHMVRTLGKEICLSVVVFPREKIPLVTSMVKEELSEYKNLLEITYSKSAVDITPMNVNKLTGLKYALSIGDYRLEEVLGVGDAENDLIWLKEVGFPCCPSNGDEAVKKVAASGYIAKNATVEGILEILKSE